MATTPEGLKTVTLVGQYVMTDDAGTACAGNLTFTPSPGLITFSTENVMVTGTQTVTLDGTGSFTVDLVCTDTAGQNPTGWTYAVVEKIIGNSPRNFNIFLPYTVATVNLADITPTTAAPTYLPVTGPQGPPGVITTVNGKTGASITLNPADIGAVATSSVGAASGVAQLDGATHVVAAQLAFASATPASVSTAGAVGTGTLIARNDHAHPGVDLTSAQTIAGVKTFSSSPIGPDPTTSTQLTTKNYSDTTYVALTGAQTVAGVKTFSSSPIAPTPTTATQVAIKSYTDGAQTFTGTKLYSQASGGSLAITTQATGDTVNEFQIAINGTHSWGPGTGAIDTILFRETANALATTDTSIRSYRAAAGSTAFSARVAADTVNRFAVGADGTITWGSGALAVDCTLFREQASIISTTATGIRAYRAAAGTANSAFSARVAADTANRWEVSSDGIVRWGPGSATAPDTNLYRSGVGALTTDTNLTVGGAMAVVGDITLVGGIYRNQVTTATTVANTVTQTNVAAMTIPANDMVVGADYRIIAWGTVSCTGTPTISFNARWDSTSIGASGARTLQSAATTRPWQCEILVTCLATGGSGSIFGQLMTKELASVAGALPATPVQLLDGSLPLTTSTTVSHSLNLAVTWSAASASNTLTCQGYIAERIS